MSQLSWMRRTKFVFRGSPLWFVFAFLRPLSPSLSLSTSFRSFFAQLFLLLQRWFCCCCCFLFRLKLKSCCVPIKKKLQFCISDAAAATATLCGNSVALQQEQQEEEEEKQQQLEQHQHGKHMWAGEIFAVLDSRSQLVQTSSPSRYSFLSLLLSCFAMRCCCCCCCCLSSLICSPRASLVAPPAGNCHLI